MSGFTELVSRAVLLLQDNVDTDQIIPARFLKRTEKAGIGAHLFADWRVDAGFVLNQPQAAGAAVLVCGDNFGCGSSREHAPWALFDAGFRALISTQFADIFYNNALQNTLLPITLQRSDYLALIEQLRSDPAAELSISLLDQRLSLPGGWQAFFPIDSFAKRCLLDGVDQLGYLLQLQPEVLAYEARHGK